MAAHDGAPVIIKRKKAHGGHAHHGGSWKVAYADFVTAMMAFFMVMWIMGLSDSTRAQIAGYFNDPVGFTRNMPASKNLLMPANPRREIGKSDGRGGSPISKEQNDIKDLKRMIQTEIQSDIDLKELMKHVETTITPEGLRIELVEAAAGAVFFESGRSTIRPLALKLISKIGPVLARSHRKVVIEGHTDSTPYPSTSYTNWELSSDRANALRFALSRAGVSPKQFKEIRGLADTQPKNPSDAKHFSNRRVTLLLPFGETRDGHVDLPREAFRRQVEGVFTPRDSARPPSPEINPDPLAR